MVGFVVLDLLFVFQKPLRSVLQLFDTKKDRKKRPLPEEPVVKTRSLFVWLIDKRRELRSGQRLHAVHCVTCYATPDSSLLSTIAFSDPYVSPGHEDNQAAVNMFTDHVARVIMRRGRLREDDREQDQHEEVVRDNST
ncbi:hypothetical protein M514_14253 [Trichuris suis]|uniref:Uncharacterized protein n=1 Tax=Trichuris suis TaxID=68888 RepID=A0A085LIS4_9BILA|nr:hypothetical protein M513_14253 [Trichuris suis]KFD59262.1 hypothetical protein M514_14253 [Trichuris suis]